jgi:Protein of unknown function (DUF3987)
MSTKAKDDAMLDSIRAFKKRRAQQTNEWPDPKPIGGGLIPVDPFDINFMPAALGPWVEDISERLQCPPDYVGVAAMAALGSLIGRRAGIKPQRKTDWMETPNLWAIFIGRPGMLKSPAMGEALGPLKHLADEAAKQNEVDQQAYAAGLSAYRVRQQVKLSLEKDALKKDPKAKVSIEMDLGSAPEEPKPIRFYTNDSSYEALGEILIGNPTGTLVVRDELVSLLQQLDRDDQAAARGFYLSGWSGTQPYTFDRIGRGHRHIEAVCLSVLGNTQPARISEYIRRANWGGAGGDGLIQRFGLMVWPDASPDWENVDEFPSMHARNAAWEVFQRASILDAVAMGATRGHYDKVPCFRFSDEAREEFIGWRADLEQRVRSGNLSPALEGHLAKYRKLVPSLALINHIADAGHGEITSVSLARAQAYAAYLESHARRVYGSGSESEADAGKAILAHIKRGDLKDNFTARDVQRHGWAHLTDRDQVGAGLSLLVDLHHLREVLIEHAPRAGRPSVQYLINPKVFGDE